MRGRQAVGETRVAISREQALDEIAESLQAIVTQHGPRAVASYTGTGTQVASVGTAFVEAWLKGLGSSMHFTSMTIDQPAKGVGAEWHGVWGAGPVPYSDADVIMLIGNNPVVSALSWPGGPPMWYPSAIGQSKKQGKCFIVVDPRHTETARHADIHLQLTPGRDAALLAGMIHVILDEGLFERKFCQTHTEGLDSLRRATADFTPDVAADLAGVPQQQLVDAARLFAGGRAAVATSATGPCMSPFANLTEYLRLCLNTLCGGWVRSGQRIATPSVLLPDVAPPAQALPAAFIPRPYNPEHNREKTRVREVRRVHGEMPTAVLADEILTPGEGQVKALVVLGGNPMAAFPDPVKTERALSSLELLVCIDIVETRTTQLADYVLPAAHPLEREDVAWVASMFAEEPFGAYAEALFDPPADIVDEWKLLWGLGSRMGTDISLAGGDVDMISLPETAEVLQLMWPGSRVSIDEMRGDPNGRIFDSFSDVRAAEPDPRSAARLQLGAEEAFAELVRFKKESISPAGKPSTSFPYLLVCRRAKEFNNSMCHDFPGRRSGSPVYMHPDDARAMRFSEGESITVTSSHGSTVAELCLDRTMRTGVISMHHCFGTAPGVKAGQTAESEGNVAMLISNEQDCDAITGMARQSAIPVSLGSAPR